MKLFCCVVLMVIAICIYTNIRGHCCAAAAAGAVALAAAFAFAFAVAVAVAVADTFRMGGGTTKAIKTYKAL